MGLDPLTGERLDPHGGARDLERGVLRATDPALRKIRCGAARRPVRRALRDAAGRGAVALVRGARRAELSGERVLGVASSCGRAAVARHGVLRTTGLLRFFPGSALVGVPGSEWHRGRLLGARQMVIDGLRAATAPRRQTRCSGRSCTT
jgi:hypothetical protein